VLTDTEIRTLKPREKAFKTFAGGGPSIGVLLGGDSSPALLNNKFSP